MQVIKNEDIAGSEREVHCPKGKFVSFRYLLKSDGVGFGLHRTEIPKGPRCRWRYKNHNEACYCVSGRGIFTNAIDGSVHLIQAGSCYVVLKGDEHYFKAIEDVVLICVFNPPCSGDEVHDEDGSYPL